VYDIEARTCLDRTHSCTSQNTAVTTLHASVLILRKSRISSDHSHCLRWCVLRNWCIHNIDSYTGFPCFRIVSSLWVEKNRVILVRLPTGKCRVARPVLVPIRCRTECVQGVNRPYHEADLSTACNIEVKNEISRTCCAS